MMTWDPTLLLEPSRAGFLSGGSAPLRSSPPHAPPLVVTVKLVLVVRAYNNFELGATSLLQEDGDMFSGAAALEK